MSRFRREHAWLILIHWLFAIPVSTKIRQESCQDSSVDNLDTLAVFAMPVSTKIRQDSRQDSGENIPG